MLKARLTALILALLILFAFPAHLFAGTEASPGSNAEAKLNAILAELIKAGVNYNSYSVDPDTGRILIVVRQEDFNLAQTVISSLDIVREEQEHPVLLSVSDAEHAVEVTPAPENGNGGKRVFPILAIIFGAAGVAVFFMKRRASRNRLIRMQY